mmetsp:Transcript_22798/g.56299  ORF Transcript_22798/g.56299 Transcript_22798/m.56299 type:complete len:297 (+) Transcript_22798:407-1297(+)
MNQSSSREPRGPSCGGGTRLCSTVTCQRRRSHPLQQRERSPARGRPSPPRPRSSCGLSSPSCLFRRRSCTPSTLSLSPSAACTACQSACAPRRTRPRRTTCTTMPSSTSCQGRFPRKRGVGMGGRRAPLRSQRLRKRRRKAHLRSLPPPRALSGSLWSLAPLWLLRLCPRRQRKRRVREVKGVRKPREKGRGARPRRRMLLLRNLTFPSRSKGARSLQADWRSVRPQGSPLSTRTRRAYAARLLRCCERLLRSEASVSACGGGSSQGMTMSMLASTMAQHLQTSRSSSSTTHASAR